MEQNKKDEYITIKPSELSNQIIKASLVAVVLFGSIQLNGIKNELTNLKLATPSVQANNENENPGANSENTDEFAQYTEAVLSSDYARDHTLDTTTLSVTDAFALSDKEYFIFFYMDSCSYCHATMPTLLEYIESGMTENADLYFAEISGSDQFWSKDGTETAVTPETFSVLGTPTVLHVKDGQYNAVVGPEAIAQMLGL